MDSSLTIELENLPSHHPLNVERDIEEDGELSREEEIKRLNGYFSEVFENDKVLHTFAWFAVIFCCPCVSIFLIWLLIEKLYLLIKSICIFFKNLYLLIYYSIHVDEGESVLPTYVNEQNSIQQNQH